MLAFTLFLFDCTPKQKRNSSVVSKSLKADPSFVTIDSAEVKANTIEYLLIFHSAGKTSEIYRVRNQDHSVEFAKNYMYAPLNYVNYQVSDLPTGLVWNIFYSKTSNAFYVTDKYDVHAAGDTIDRKSVSFSRNVATVVSMDDGKRYKIGLKKIWCPLP
ncbi:hypothetical protein C8P68_101376 [Mucilaginibacter yixingensis]|uniref:Uncharacterized protein n=2 Tax=Mucilaginibacter yixingensis TaxID=1295612 RepID=A0A2T5JFD0_9SPHI|nr:hypothetical protein C8P68_101376 [Mucilaginibacter yixingensis]